MSGLDDPRRATLRILLRIPGYGRSDTLDTRAGPDGRFTVTLRPDVTTRVQVVVHNTLGVSGRSPTRTITVLPRQRLGLVRTSESRARFTLLLEGPTSVRLIGANSVRPRRGSARRAHLYAVAPGGRVAHRIDTAPLRSDSYGQYCEYRATGSFAVTARVRRARGFFACTRGQVIIGVGAVGSDRQCGRGRISDS